METFKSIMVFASVCAFFAFNLKLHVNKEGVFWSQAVAEDGWHVKCRYYTAFQFYVVDAPIQTGCATYAPVPAESHA